MNICHKLSLGLVLLSLLLSVTASVRHNDLEARAAATAEALTQLAALRQNVVDAESDAKDYLLTGSARALASYRGLMPVIAQRLAELGQRGGNARQRAFIENLDRHVYRRFSIVDAWISLEDNPLAREAVAQTAPAGTAEMQAIKRAIVELEREQSRPLARSRAVHEAQSAKLQMACIGAILAALVALAFAWLLNSRRAAQIPAELTPA